MAKKRVWLDIYDEDGLKCEEIGVPANADAVREEMVSALQSDGIPVIREAIVKGKSADKARVSTLTVRLEVDNVKFSAVGEVDDVLEALDDVLRALEADDA